jgi:type VI protein secretion system component VasF
MIYLLSATEAVAATSPVEAFLKHLPEVAASPLAFVAYCLVIAAWVAAILLTGTQERKTEEILNQFKDDHVRLKALAKLINKEPPEGLTGNKAILEWVTANNRSRSKMLFLVGWILTLVALIIFVVAWRATPVAGGRHVEV